MLCLVGMMAVGVAVGCNGTPPKKPVVPVTGTAGEPAWVTQGGSAFKDGDQAFYGVGIGEAKRIPALYLRRTSAINRGRNAVAGQLKVMIQSVFKDYVEAAMTPNMKEAESQSLTSIVQKSVIDETLMGAKTRELWKDPSTGDYYALIRLGKDTVAQELRSAMIKAEKGRLRKTAAEAHADLDAIIAKHRKRSM